MSNLIPEYISEQYYNGLLHGKIIGYSVMVDIHGFTNLTQSLMSHGSDGAETITDTINHIFTPAIASIYKHGGFVCGFAGDAFTAVFPSEIVPVRAVLSAALEIKEYFINRSSEHTKYGDFELSMHIGIGGGTILWEIIPTAKQHLYYFTGSAIKGSAASKKYAETNDIIIDESIITVSRLPHPTSQDTQENINCVEVASKYYRLLSCPRMTITGKSTKRKAPQTKFVPKSVRDLRSTGEFRDVISCFINLQPELSNTDVIRKIAELSHLYGGYFNKIDYGDKGWVIVVLFGAPTAFEKMEQRACEFALAVHSNIKTECRIGLSFGKAFAGFIGSDLRSEYTAIGYSVNLAARLMIASLWGEIYLVPELYNRVQDEYRFRSAGDFTLDGFPKPIQVHALVDKQLIKESQAYSGKFVGRTEEFTQLQTLCEPVLENKSGGIVYLYGEAGIGKSRLVLELQNRLRDQIQFLFLQNDSVLQQPYNPFTYFIRQYFRDTVTGSLKERLDRFRTRWAEFVGQFSDVPGSKALAEELYRIESIIANLIGLQWEDSIFSLSMAKDRPVLTQSALKELIVAFTHLRPTVLVIEDMQWLDDESKKVFAHFTHKLESIPLLVLTVSRFADDGTKPELQTGSPFPCIGIDLNQFSRTDTGELVKELLQFPPSEELTDFIYETTQGNPFFVEQITVHLSETKHIINRDGEFQLIRSDIHIPDRIESVLISRIDRLESNLKETVQIASVLGREFATEALHELIQQYHSAVGNKKTGLSRKQLNHHLQTGEKERIWNTLSEINYIFSHSLLREAAYHMQLKKRLQSLHKLAGESLRILFPKDKEKFFEIAEHYDRAEEWDKAIKYYNRAGDNQLEQYHFSLAQTAFEKQLSILQTERKQHKSEIAICYQNLGTLYFRKADYDKGLEFYTLALAIQLDLFGERSSDTAKSYDLLGSTYFQKGEIKKGLEYHTKALDIRLDVLGEKNPDTAASLNIIGNICSYNGDFAQAQEYFSRSLKIRKELSSEDNTETASCYNNIGVVFIRTGDYDKALEYYSKAASIGEAAHKSPHPATAACYNNIGIVYDKKGDYDKAIEFHSKAFAVWRTFLGEKHPNVAISHNNIGKVYEEKGDYGLALEHHTKALAIALETLGDTHPDTALSYSNIGTDYYKKGDFERALENHLKALKIRQSVFGDSHSSTGVSHYDLGLVYHKKGEFGQALQSYMKGLAIRLDTYGERHPETASSYDKLGLIFFETGDYGLALEYHLKALAIRQELLGNKHPDTASSYNSSGNVYSYKGELTLALEYYQMALSIRQEILGDKHPDTGSSFNNMGIIYFRRGDFNRALEYYLKALAIWQNTIGSKHGNTATSCNNIGTVYFKMGEYTLSLEFHEKALSVWRELLGENHPNIAISFNNIGKVYNELGKFDEALEYHQKALAICGKNLGEHHPETAACYNAVGNIYYKKEKIDTALEFHNKALAIQREMLGEKHSAVAISYDNIGLCLAKKNEMAAAWENLEMALNIRLESFGEFHPDTAITFTSFGEVYSNSGSFDKALENENRALVIRQSVLGEDHPDTASSYYRVGLLFKKEHNLAKAKKYFAHSFQIRQKVFGESHPYTLLSKHELEGIK